ncbi:MAG: hypothetical protein WC928_03145 [Patescibacteria group bacterium]|jgi:magnesium-transporting ATPase (P-type)
MKNKILKIYTLVLMFPLLFISLSPLLVGASFFEEKTGLKVTADKTGHLEQKIFSGDDSLEIGIATVINVILSFVGVVFMVLIIYGGILWMTAGGNDQQIEKAKKIFLESIIGLVVVLLAYAISIFIFSVFINKTLLD